VMELQHVDARVAQRNNIVTICLRDVFNTRTKANSHTKIGLGFGLALGAFSMLHTHRHRTSPLRDEVSI